MRTLLGLKIGLLVVCLLTAAAGPATAQLADPLSLASSGVLLPFFSDPAAGFVSLFEIASPVTGDNPLRAAFFAATCDRNGTANDVQTAKQAKTYISSAPPFLLNFNGLAAIAAPHPVDPDALVPLSFPIHSRVHWIDVRTGHLRDLEPIALDSFSSLAGVPTFGLCNSPATPGNNGFCWNPLRSAASFVTPQESVSLRASVILICPRGSIQNPTAGGVFRTSLGFPRLVNRDGSFGFLGSHTVTGTSVARLRGRIYDDNEVLVRDIEVPCDCLTNTPVVAIDPIYNLPPTNLGAHTVPSWYTELESTAQTNDPVTPVAPQHNSFTGYWNVEVAGTAARVGPTIRLGLHRMSNASRDNLSNGFNNAFTNR